MPAVDRALLRIGVWEILYVDEVPDLVAISEAVEAATVLSTDDSAGFVNVTLGGDLAREGLGAGAGSTSAVDDSRQLILERLPRAELERDDDRHGRCQHDEEAGPHRHAGRGEDDGDHREHGGRRLQQAVSAAAPTPATPASGNARS